MKYILKNRIAAGLLDEVRARGKSPEDYNHDPLQASRELGIPLKKRYDVMKILDVSSTSMSKYLNVLDGVSWGCGCYLFSPSDIEKIKQMKRGRGRPILEV